VLPFSHGPDPALASLLSGPYHARRAAPCAGQSGGSWSMRRRRSRERRVPAASPPASRSRHPGGVVLVAGHGRPRCAGREHPMRKRVMRCTLSIHRISGRLLSRALLLAALLAAACRPATEAPAPTPAAARAPERSATDAPTKLVRSTGGVVVSATEIASRIGRDVLASGGNALDAAIATGFALAVTHPAAGNIGGGGFIVIRFPDGRTTSFNFREKAPLRAHPEMFLDSTGRYSSRLHHDSHLAVGVPGTVAGFALAHERYGSKPWRELVEP